MKNIRIILLIIGVIAFTLLSCKSNTNKDNKKEQPTNHQQDSIMFKKDVTDYIDVDKSGLEGKIFYYVEKDKNDEYYASRYPTAFGSGIISMKFKENRIIDGDNFMEPTVYIVKKIQKKNTYIRYTVNVLGNPDFIETINYNYNKKKGYLSYNNHIRLIDSLKMKGIKVIDIEIDE